MRTTYGLRGREAEIVEVYNYFKKHPNEQVKNVASQLEYSIYKYMAPYYSRRFGVEVEVLWEDEARSKGIPKAERALPLKPSIFIA